MTNSPRAFAFLHGGGQGSWVWERTIAELEARSSVYCLALDVPGCGRKRDRDTSGISFQGIVDELVDDLLAWGRNEIVLVGHSQGGTVLPKLARALPDRIERLVYLACSLPLPGQTVVEMIGKGKHGSNPETVGWPFDPVTAPQAHNWNAMFTAEMDPELKEEFRAKSPGQNWPMSSYAERSWDYPQPAAPSTFLLCTRDQALPEPWQEVFAQRLHCERVVRMEADHQAMLTQPAKLAELLLADAA